MSDESFGTPLLYLPFAVVAEIQESGGLPEGRVGGAIRHEL